MCLDRGTLKKYKKPEDWIEGYKVLIYNARWQSEWAAQSWEFAEMVKATQRGAGFFGVTSFHYRNGIHAYKDFQSVGCFRSRASRVVRVLLFGVTHEDHECYRADEAIIVEALDWRGKRVPW